MNKLILFAVLLLLSVQIRAELTQLELAGWCTATSSNSGVSVGEHLFFAVTFTSTDIAADCCNVFDSLQISETGEGGIIASGGIMAQGYPKFQSDRFQFRYSQLDITFELVYASGFTASNFEELELVEVEKVICDSSDGSSFGDFVAETDEFILTLTSASNNGQLVKDVPIPIWIFMLLGMFLVAVAVRSFSRLYR